MKPKPPIKDNVLDITDLKETGVELMQAIHDAVKDTQSVIITTLPNVLIMTSAQFESLDPYGEIVSTYRSKDRVYITPLNAMDVVIKDKA